MMGIETLRRRSAARMPDTTEILRTVTTTDAEGYERTTDAVIATTRSRGVALSAREELRANQAGYEADAKRYLPFGTDVRAADRLRIGGVVYEVLSLNAETSAAFRAHVECLVRRTG